MRIIRKGDSKSMLVYFTTISQSTADAGADDRKAAQLPLVEASLLFAITNLQTYEHSTVNEYAVYVARFRNCMSKGLRKVIKSPKRRRKKKRKKISVVLYTLND